MDSSQTSEVDSKNLGHQVPDLLQEQTMLNKNRLAILDTSKGYEGRCKKVGQYLLGSTIGEGSYGKIRLGKHLITKQQVAVKVVSKKTLVQKEAARRHFRREALMLQRVHHPHVTRLYQALETGNSYYLVFELATGGSLFHVLSRKGILSERESCFYMRQIVSALDHLHKSDIVHRDLKLENVLLDEHSNVKLVDFGLSAVCQDSDTALSTQCGSPLYAAPELFAGRKYGKPVDIWSLGVSLYALLVGRLPFLPGEGASLLQLYSLLLKGCELPKHLSESCKDILSRMLEVHESRRISLDDILTHPWLTGPEAEAIKRVPPVPKKLSELAVDNSIVKYICTMFRFSERDVITSVVERKLTPAAATYHILHDGIESGRVSVSFTRDLNVTGAEGNITVLPTSEAAQRSTETSRENLLGHSTYANRTSRAAMAESDGPKSKGTETQSSDNRVLQSNDTGKEEKFSGSPNNSSESFLPRLNPLSSLPNGVGMKDGFSSKENHHLNLFDQNRDTISESTDSGVGVEGSEEILVNSTEPEESEQALTSCQETKDKTKKPFSYKNFIMDLKECRQKSKFDQKINQTSINNAVAQNRTSDENRATGYVLIGHSPRNNNPNTEEAKRNSGGQFSKDDLPAVTSSSMCSSLNPTFPPLGTRSASPQSSSSSLAYSSMLGSGQHYTGVKYNTYISSNDGSFYYSSKPIPGFRQGNRYYLHFDKSNCSAFNLGINDKNRLSCESFAVKFVNNQNAVLGKTHYAKDSMSLNRNHLYSVYSPQQKSFSCTPFSYKPQEKTEETEYKKSAVDTRGCFERGGILNQRNTRPTPHTPVTPLKLSVNDSSLHVQSLTTINNNTKTVNSFYGSPELCVIFSETVDSDNGNRLLQHDARFSQTSLQKYCPPPYTLSSLKGHYGADPWRSSKSEKADLSRAMRRGLRNKQGHPNRGQACEPLSSVNSSLYKTTRKSRSEASRKRKGSKHTRSHKGSQSDESFSLKVPDRHNDDDSSSSLSRSELTTPDGEDFMMPVTSVVITTKGRH
ncbi:hormonally up-regulated neu-associated kinase [Plakobranchus ocellatus]|uniref:non-specific serine/threonine protein kinase n=1 Tax=Plakobranchus ocellatus TaxID=259542 RepID=A0AAV4D9C4_9GAST|nr:hormonally up-regulated neu-associated kinase [Plakobranchus ocellatus]